MKQERLIGFSIEISRCHSSLPNGNLRQDLFSNTTSFTSRRYEARTRGIGDGCADISDTPRIHVQQGHNVKR